MPQSPEDFNRSVDFGRTATDYATHRAGFPDEFFDRLLRFDVGHPDQTILDLGTGTGTVARGFAARGAHVVALDPALPLMRASRDLDRKNSVDVRYFAARAETIPLADASLDTVVAGQCWHWFDRPATLTEVARLLRPGGHLVIAYLNWLPLPGNVVQATESLIESHNPAWHFGGGTGITGDYLADIATHGYKNIETFSFDLDVPYTHEAWRGRIRASAGVSATLSPDAVARFDDELQQLLTDHYPDEPLFTPHRVFAIIARRPV